MQVSIPGLPVPISLSLNHGGATAGNSSGGLQQQQQQGGSVAPSSSSVILASPQQQSVGSCNNSTTASGAGQQQTVVLATATSQGHLLHLPIVHGSQLAAQLNKPPNQQQPTSINMLHGLSGSSGVVTANNSNNGAELLVSSASLLPRPPQPVVSRASKQQVSTAETACNCRVLLTLYDG